MSDNQYLRPALKTGSVLFGTLGTAIGLRFAMDSTNAAKTFGISSATTGHPYLKVLGGRTLSGGLVLLSLAYLGRWQEVGIALLCGSVSAMGDAYFVKEYGGGGEASGHAITALIMAGIGWGLYNYA